MAPAPPARFRRSCRRDWRENGAGWKVNGESIYNDAYWARGAPTATCDSRWHPTGVLPDVLTPPGDTVTVHSPVPIRPGGHVSLLGYHGPALHWDEGV